MTSMLKYFKPHRGSGFTASNQICLKLSVLPNEIWLHRKFIGFSAESNQFTSFGHQAWEITISDKQWDRQPVRSNGTTSQTPFRFSPYLPHRCRISHLVRRVQSRASSACENRQLYPQTHWTKKEHEATWKPPISNAKAFFRGPTAQGTSEGAVLRYPRIFEPRPNHLVLYISNIIKPQRRHALSLLDVTWLLKSLHWPLYLLRPVCIKRLLGPIWLSWTDIWAEELHLISRSHLFQNGLEPLQSRWYSICITHILCVTSAAYIVGGANICGSVCAIQRSVGLWFDRTLVTNIIQTSNAEVPYSLTWNGHASNLQKLTPILGWYLSHTHILGHGS